MPARRLHSSLVLVGLLPLLLGTTYKWRDEQGQVHLGDRPPPAGVTYEVVSPAGARPTANPPPPPIASIPPAPAVAATSPAAVDDAELAQADAAVADRRCLEAHYQLELLVGKYKVFKPGPGDTRTYLDDPDRPAEIARLEQVRDEACSHEQPLQGSQKRRAAELFQALSADCREAREELARMAQPDSRSSRNEIERRYEWMTRYCPDVPDADTHTDVWLADRVWQWHAR